MQTVIRTEQPEDVIAIHSVTKKAFEGKPYAGGDEQDLIDLLRSNNALALSLVALRGDKLVGQATFSLANNDDESAPWFALGPIAVLPSYQSQGLGAKLIEEGLSRLTHLGALGCILTGNPNYYQRFGFELSPQHVPAGEPEAYFQVKLLSDVDPKGRFAFAKEFYASV